MGFWDWATTARENVQSALAPGVKAPSVTASDFGSNLKDAWSGGILPHIMGALTTGNPLNTVMANKPGVFQQLAGPQTPAAATDPSQQQQPTTPGGGQVEQWNPLAVNMFYSTAIAPLLQQLAGKFQSTDQNLLQMAQNAPGQQYIPQQYQALAKQNLAQMGLDANNVSQSMLGAALTGPVIDSLQNQMSTLSQRALQAYTEALRQGASTNINSILGPQAGTTGTTSTTGTTITPTQTETIKALVDSLTQPTGP